MLGTPTILFGVAGAAFVAASAAPALVGYEVSPARSLTRGDRLSDPINVQRVPVASIEIWGAEETRVILRDREGEVVYMSDPVAGTTIAVRGAEIPRIVFRPATGTANSRSSDKPAAEEGKDRRPVPVGCEGSVSPLASPEAKRTLNLCLASLDPEARS
jgi:hypothetical protein